MKLKNYLHACIWLPYGFIVSPMDISFLIAFASSFVYLCGDQADNKKIGFESQVIRVRIIAGDRQ